MTARPPNRFKERELARALRAAKSAGGVKRVEVRRDGTIALIMLDGTAVTEAGEAVQNGGNPWDEVLTDAQD